MMKRWIWICSILALSACTPSDGDNNITDMGSDATPDLNPTPEECERIMFDGDLNTLNDFANRCSASGCQWDSVWPTYEKGGRCFFEDARAYKCFSTDSGSDQEAVSFVNRETNEVLVFNSSYLYIDGWIPCQGATPGDEDTMPEDHICWTCAPDWDLAL